VTSRPGSWSRSTLSLFYVTRPSRPYTLFGIGGGGGLVISGPVSEWGAGVTSERRIQLWALVITQADGAPVTVEHVGAVAMLVAGADAVAVAVVLSASPRETIYASDRVASTVEELTLTLGEGPGMDALTGGPALVADLTGANYLARWPVFAPAAAGAGVRAMFALPLRIGAIRLGVLDLYRAEPGGLDHEQLADVLVLADTMGALLLDEAGRDRPRPDGSPEHASGQHPVVHQATGMVLVQLGVTAAVALIRLRAYAYAHDRRLRDVAADVVARRLRFDPER